MTLPKLNLRDLFWLVVVVAIGLGWWRTTLLHHQAIEKLQDEIDQRELALVEFEAEWLTLKLHIDHLREQLAGQVGRK